MRCVNVYCALHHVLYNHVPLLVLESVMNGQLLDQLTQILCSSKAPAKIVVQSPEGQAVVSTIIAAVHAAYPSQKEQAYPLVSVSGSDVASAVCAHLSSEGELNSEGIMASHACLNLIKQVAKSNHGILHIHCQTPLTPPEEVTLQKMLDNHIKDRGLDLRKTCLIFSGHVEQLAASASVKTISCEDLPVVTSLTTSRVQASRSSKLHHENSPAPTRCRVAG